MDRRTLIVSGLATLSAAGAAKAQEQGQPGPYQTPNYPAAPPEAQRSHMEKARPAIKN